MTSMTDPQKHLLDSHPCMNDAYDYTSFSTIFQSFQGDKRVITKGFMQWNPAYV